MAKLRRLVLVRHGETDGESGQRFHGSGDVALSKEGRAQMRRVAACLSHPTDLVVASPLRRSWTSAVIAGRGAEVRLESRFREIHFGRWEGLTKEEIRASDPILYEDWQARKPGFEYPGGELRDAFRERVQAGLDGLLAADARDALLVLHKGVIRTIVEELTGVPLDRERPALAEIVGVSRQPDGSWFLGRHSSNPPALSA